MKTSPVSSPDLELVRLVLATADTVLREGQRLFKPLGLTVAQFNVLNVVARVEAGLSQRELGDVLVVDRSNVTGLVDRMARAGWVRREEHPDDRRAYRVRLTPAGRRLQQKAAARYAAAWAKVTQQLDACQIPAALAVLQTLHAGAANWQ
jgi:DNA-binding MarR family transcriptional regulator